MNVLCDFGYVILIIIKIVFINIRDELLEKWWEGGDIVLGICSFSEFLLN